VRVETSKGHYTSAKLVITAGPWATINLSVPSQWRKIPLTVMRQVPLWFAPPDLSPFRRDIFPIWIAEVPQGHFYGLPAINPWGHKTARHYGAPELATPDLIEREVTAMDEQPVRQFIREHLPAGDGPLAQGSVCIYTLTPDRHFVIDRHPNHANVAIAAGFSGHGFKFAPVIGEILADLALSGVTDQSIEMFSLKRFL
jgi:sarcosine oxidase